MRCALFFGSFNPLHYGHVSIARYLLAQCSVDQVRLILSPKNPLKDARVLSDADERLCALRKSVAELCEDRICVSDVEFHLPSPLYTINTLRYLREAEPDNELILVIGADNMVILEEWHEWQALIQEFEIWVYPRKGSDGEGLCRHYASLPGTRGIRFLADAPLYNISSTEIREGR